nr:asparagine synthase (glutamine-hydrolyzing) [Bacteriovorax sp. HI3]
MCGIFGFSRVSQDNPDALLDAMAQMQLHRGPDGEGRYVTDKFALGMRRLSIIDINSGHQPFYSENQDIVVFCNGEIFNYVELRSELEKDGVKFKTHSDIEVLPHLYEKHGLEFVHLLNGMYGICIFDKKTNSIHLVRDRLGVKPIYYSFENGIFAYASELKSILALNTFKPTVDFSALSTYLDLLYIPCPKTGFNEIKKIPSGSVLTFNASGIKISQYWGPQKFQPIEDENLILEKIESLLEDSIRIQMRSDVPVGAYLSGGLDSSGVVAYASTFTETPLNTFHLSWENLKGKINEESYAKGVSSLYKTNFNLSNFSDIDLLNLLPKLIWHMEEPLADAAFVPTYTLAKTAAESVKVVLSGAGGDELFGGYSNHKKYPLHESFLRLILQNSCPASSSYDRWKDNRYNWKKIFSWYEKNSGKEEFDTIFKKFKNDDELNAQMLSDTFNYLQDDILLLTDKMTMATSLECRVPLLDHRLVELSWQIPSRFKVKNNERKFIFKKLLEKKLPHELIYRKKEGFGIPVDAWTERYLKEFQGILSNGYLARNNLIKLADINEIRSWQLWKVVVLEIWAQLFIEGKKASDINQA